MIILTKVGRLTHCGWRHSLGWNPELHSKRKAMWVLRHSPLSLGLSIQCDQVPQVPIPTSKKVTEVSETVQQVMVLAAKSDDLSS